MKKNKIAIIIGTRPEAIKMAPIIEEMRSDSKIDLTVISTGQHKELLLPIFDLFKIKIDKDLNTMKKNQTLVDIQNNVLSKSYAFFKEKQFDLVLTQGDTSSVYASSLAAFYLKIPVGHVEAGLRTSDIYNPFPEEMNRRLVSKIATLHFCPTKASKINLQKEGVKNNLFVTGNTVIDSLLKISKKINLTKNKKKTILITCHRRENLGEPLKEILEAVLELAKEREDIEFLYPLHPNPKIKKIALEKLSNIKNIKLSEPLDYFNFIKAMKNSYIILTDSGGVQEEAPALGKPVLVLRENTERPEAVNSKVAKLVGHDKNKIKKEVLKLLDNKDYYNKFTKKISPYGDGKSAKKIKAIILKYLNI